MKIEDQLKRDEGYKTTPYYDSVGIATIGVGHRLDLPLCPAAIEAQLRHDIEGAELQCQNWAFWPRLSDPRRGVLINMVFNLGFEGVREFRKMLAAIDANDFDRAADEMLSSRWAYQVGDRAQRLARQMRDDVWT